MKWVLLALVLALVAAFGCAHPAPYCAPLIPAPMPSPCYPVDVASGQRLCVEQVAGLPVVRDR
jgi:hypothetical protein